MTESIQHFDKIEDIIDDIRAGKMVVLMDDEDRENEGDLVMAATHVRPEDINFMITHARGLVCLPMTKERCQRLNLNPMASQNGARFGTAFTQSIEAKDGVTTGISAADRARTIQAAVSATAKAEDIVQPGHVFPIMAQDGGVLHRAGHTEASCDLSRLAGLEPAAVIVEIIKEDGEMARRDDLIEFAKEHNLKIGTIADLIHYRIANEKTVEQTNSFAFESEHGSFTLHQFTEKGTNDTHIALVKGKPEEGVTAVRVHGLNPLRDLFGATTNLDGHIGWSIQSSLQYLSQCDRGVFVWIADNQPIDLASSLKAFTQTKQETKPSEPTEAERTKPYRGIGVGAQILRELGVQKMQLLSSAMKFNALSGFDLEVVEYVPASKNA